MAYMLFRRDKLEITCCEKIEDIQRYVEKYIGATCTKENPFDIPEFLANTLCVELGYDHMSEEITYNGRYWEGISNVIPRPLSNFIRVESFWKFAKVE